MLLTPAIDPRLKTKTSRNPPRKPAYPELVDRILRTALKTVRD